MEWLNNLGKFFAQNQSPILFTIGLTAVYILIRFIITRLIKNQAHRNNIAYDREVYMRKLTDVLMSAISLTALGAIWEISIQGLSLYFASILTVLGVALFATWSVLSNLTSSIFLFFFFPYRIGQKVRIIDSENTLEGIILDINLFYIKIETEEGNIVAYPNNLAIQKPMVIRFK